jgi:photosystem I subunit 11
MVVRADASPKPQAVQPINGDPFIGMFETPITSTPEVATFLSGLPGYRTGISPVLRGVEIGLAHGFFLPGPFIKLGPLRNVVGEAEIAGCLSGAGLVVILAACLSIYGSAAFQKTVVNSAPANLGVKTLSGRETVRDPLQTADGWNGFSAGWLVGGLSGVVWCYILTQTLPYYNLSP